MSALAMFVPKYPSLLSFERCLHGDECAHDLTGQHLISVSAGSH